MSAAATLAGAAPDVASPPPGWHSINWRKVWRNVRRLQARIVKAVQEGRWGKVHALVYLLTHSFSGRAAAILQVTTNQGATTPGVDLETWNTPELKADAFSKLRRHGYHPLPLRRVYIPKSSNPSKLRPLGIPTLTDRAMQALYLLGFDPIEETLADANSYGFRQNRCCADALDQCHKILRNNNSASWIFEGDIKACFDKISQEWMLTHIPMDKVILRKWLQAEFIDKNVFFATTEGTPQGGICSPALANRTLDGLEALLHQRFGATRKQRERNHVHLVRYADDFIITGTSKLLLEYEVRPLVVRFLTERGLELSHEKTKITHIDDGFDFLGQNIRRYGTKVLLKPSCKNVRSFLAKIREIIQQEGRRLSAGQLIKLLNTRIRGWARLGTVSPARRSQHKKTFARVDDAIFRKLWQWARRRHRGKSKKWVKKTYFTTETDKRWKFRGTLSDGKGGKKTIYLARASAMPIRRQVKIQGQANPYDPAWEVYFEERLTHRMSTNLTGRWIVCNLWTAQKGKCLVCGEALVEAEGWHMHHLVPRVQGGLTLPGNLVLLHPNCHRQVHSEGLVVEKTASREGR